jgi:hypothetical protein
MCKVYKERGERKEEGREGKGRVMFDLLLNLFFYP